MANSRWRSVGSLRTAAFVALLFGTLHTPLNNTLAHVCGPTELHVTVGEACPWRITADRLETTTLYTPILTGTNRVVSLTPAVPFQAHHGDFVIRGLGAGTNDVVVSWFYPGTGAAGVCQVRIVVSSPVAGQASFQTSRGHGQLCTYEFGRFIEARTLRSLLDYFVPAEAAKLIVLTECFGGNVAQSPFFVNMPNTAIASGTSANQEGRTGGYPDDAARALKPGTGRTAADVHHAGTIGRQTVEQVDNPQNDKETAFILSEWPTTAGAVQLSGYSLAPVSNNGSIESRHVVMYAGNPIAKSIAVETHAGATIPSIDGQKQSFGDALDRETIKQNFASEPNTSVSTAGGAPQADNRQLGQNGWDYSGTLDGLQAAIKKAGDAIRNSPHPEREQFILFIGDHGMAGSLGKAPAPERPASANSRSEIASSFQTLAPDEPLAFSMEQDPNNVPGFLLSLEVDSKSSPVPSLRTGELALELDLAPDKRVLLSEFVATPVDIDGDGKLGTRDGEGLSVFFPVEEQTLLGPFAAQNLQVFLVNHSSLNFTVSALEQVTGSIEPGWTSSPRPKLLQPIVGNSGVEFLLHGSLGRSYTVETSQNLRTWRTIRTQQMTSPTQRFQDVAPTGPAYYRARLIE